LTVRVDVASFSRLDAARRWCAGALQVLEAAISGGALLIDAARLSHGKLSKCLGAVTLDGPFEETAERPYTYVACTSRMLVALELGGVFIAAVGEAERILAMTFDVPYGVNLAETTLALFILSADLLICTASRWTQALVTGKHRL
jgi:hypothetical protein